MLTRQREWKIQTGQHNGCEYPPPKYTRDETESATSGLEPSRKDNVAVVELEIRTSEHGKCQDQCKKYHEEANVGPNRADKVDKAHDAHGDEKEGWLCVSRSFKKKKGACNIRHTETIAEANSIQALGRVVHIR
jgi:hypothetical protein